VGDVVAGIARYDPVSHGHGTVGADGEDPHQLAQIRAVVLVVAESDRRGGLAASGPAVRAVVIASEGHAGRVVVQLRAVRSQTSAPCAGPPRSTDSPGLRRRACPSCGLPGRRSTTRPVPIPRPKGQARRGRPIRPARRPARGRRSGCAPPPPTRRPERGAAGDHQRASTRSPTWATAPPAAS
jgi:hypothetical protein